MIEVYGDRADGIVLMLDNGTQEFRLLPLLVKAFGGGAYDEDYEVEIGALRVARAQIETLIRVLEKQRPAISKVEAD